MSIQGPGILWRLRAGGSCPGLANTRSGATATLINRAGLLQTPTANLLRLHWHDGNGDGVYETPTYKIEPAATNIMLWSRDFTTADSGATWTKTNCTAALTATGVTGAANSATLLTATAGNGTCLQSVTSGSSARSFTAFIKRVTGTGVINMTMDNGSTWTAIVPTTQYTRFRVPVQTLTNPTVGFRIVTSGDAIAVDYCQLESTNYDTTPILTTSGSATRNADSCSATFPYRPVAMTLYVKYVATTQNPAAPTNILQVGSGATAPRLFLALTVNGQLVIQHENGVSSVNSSIGSQPAAGQLVEGRAVLNADGSVLVGQSINAGAESVSAASGALAMGPAWSGTVLSIGSATAMGLVNGLILSGVRTMDQCRGLI